MGMNYERILARAEPSQITDARRTGVSLFRAASIECPNSYVGQGSHIARDIRQQGIVFEPPLMAAAINTDSHTLEVLTMNANAYHTLHNADRVVDVRTMERVVKDDFLFANALVVCSMQDLNAFITRYHTLRGEGKLPLGELLFLYEAKGKIKQRRAEQGLRTDVPLFTA